MPVRRSSNHIPSEDLDAPPKQGIVTILGADCDKGSKAGSIRRTLSADMSSKKWLQQNGFFSPMKKIVSSHQIADHHSDDEEFNLAPNQDEVWRSIQAEKEKNELQKPPQTGVWGIILTQKSDNSLLQPPYIHPMVKRTKSGLSEKSLEVCTESLGSETGSDCFSCHELSSDGDEDRDEMQRSEQDPFADLHVVKYKKSPARPFPPPLPSIAGGDGGASLHMHSHRENGRLVLEAVSVAPRNYFHAARQDGRLLLTLKHAPAELEAEEEEVAPLAEVVERKKGGGKEESLVELEQNLSLPTGMISVHKSMKKLMAVGNNNINPKWANEAATRDGGEVRQSLPPRPPVGPAAAASFNAYEYFWRSKPGFMISNKNSKMNQDLVLYMRGCKEARRSLIWEPYCIATS